MITDFRPIKAALVAHLQANTSISFTAQAAPNDATLYSPSTTAGMVLGLPVFGDGVADGTNITEIAADGSSITLSQPLTIDALTGDPVFTAGFLTLGPRVKHWTQVADQPALFVRRTGVVDEEQDPFLITTLDYEAWVYSNSGQDPDVDPDDQLSALECLIRNAFSPDYYDDDGGRFTLSAAMKNLGMGPVYWCRVSGKSDTSTGDQGAQAIARIPIRITIP